MYTLIGILVLCTIIANIRLYKICKIKKVNINPFEGSLFDYFFFILGNVFIIVCIGNLIIKYLP